MLGGPSAPRRPNLTARTAVVQLLCLLIDCGFDASIVVYQSCFR